MGRQGGSDGGSSAPTLWIAMAAVLGVAAIGLAIWAFGQKSDLDDQKEKLAEVEQRFAKGDQERAAKNQAVEGFSEKDASRYRAVRAKLIATDRQEANFKDEATREANALQQAQNELNAAKTSEERTMAKANAAKAKRKAAITCAQGTVDAISAFDTQGGGANNPSSAAKSAIGKLEAISGPCQTVIGE